MGDETLLTVTPLPVKSALAETVESQFVAAARLNVVELTDEVPFLFNKPFTASLSVAFKVTEKDVLLEAATLALVSV